jgi:hypothetical protein
MRLTWIMVVSLALIAGKTKRLEVFNHGLATSGPRLDVVHLKCNTGRD